MQGFCEHDLARNTVIMEKDNVSRLQVVQHIHSNQQAEHNTALLVFLPCTCGASTRRTPILSILFLD